LIQGGFDFPSKEDVLVPAVSVFGCPELRQDVAVTVGRTASHVCVRVGPWTIHLAIDQDGRVPQVDRAVPPQTGTTATCRFAPEDAALLLEELPRLPGQKDE
jgi:hypothetical protein